MSNKGSPTAASPMIYDPVSDGTARTTKTMQFVAAVGVSMAALSAGSCLAWTSPVLPQLQSNSSSIVVDNIQGSWIGSFLAVGAFCGALPAGYLADKIGRRYSAMLIALPYLISWALIVFAQNVGILYVARFFAGIATGASCVVAPMYISEIAETSVRGALGAFFQSFLTVGILFIYVVGAVTSWVTLSYLCAIFPVILIVAMFLIPDSPTYLVKQGRRIDAGLALKWFWGKDCDTQTAVQAIQNDIDAVSDEASFKDLFTHAANRAALIISLLLMFFQQFSGINAVIFYTAPIFESAGSDMDPSVCAIVVGVVQVLMTFTSAVLIERAGRRFLLLQSGAIMGICLVILGIFFHIKAGGSDVSNIGWMPLFSVVLFIISFSLGFGPIPWMIMGELFAADIKGLAAAIAVMFNWLLVFVVTFSFESMNAILGQDWTFWFFGGWMAVCTVYVFFKVPETKGKSNAEVQLMLAGKR